MTFDTAIVGVLLDWRIVNWLNATLAKCKKKSTHPNMGLWAPKDTESYLDFKNIYLP
jgi:hypothetical protein